MAVKTWETIKVRYCHHTNAEVELEAQLFIPLSGYRPTRIWPPLFTLSPQLDGRPSCVGLDEPVLRSIRE
jgi:hypothetical protein